MGKRLFHRNPSRQELLDAIRTQQEQIVSLQQLVQDICAAVRQEVKGLGDVLDARIWQAEEGLGKRLEEMNKCLDARTWQAEEGIGKRLDEHGRQTERKIKEGFWNLHYELRKKDYIDQPNKSVKYDDVFYWINRYGSVMSARVILREILNRISCNSVVDFGCGTGTWLWVARNYGVSELLGVDGDYVPREMLMIPESCFSPADLSKVYEVKKKFDLAISVEVAEHLPPEAADIFVSNLCCGSNIVLFSAAHVGQGGDGHLNEQPVSYWTEKFASHDYRPIEIRHFFQYEEDVEPWYKDNLIMFVHSKEYEDINGKIKQC